MSDSGLMAVCTTYMWGVLHRQTHNKSFDLPRSFTIFVSVLLIEKKNNQIISDLFSYDFGVKADRGVVSGHSGKLCIGSNSNM